MSFQAEQELLWYFGEAQTALDLSAHDPAAEHGETPGWDYTDKRLDILHRAAPIRAALRACKRRDERVLQLAFTERAWKGALWFDYYRPYGARLAAIVQQFYKLKGDEADRRMRASALLAEALRSYEVHRAKLADKSALQCA